MALVHFLCLLLICFGLEGKVNAEDNPNCQKVATAVKTNSSWIFCDFNNVLRWVQKTSSPLPRCVCTTKQDESGGCSSIVLMDYERNAPISNVLCTGCTGQEVATDDIKFSADPPSNGRFPNSFGPCTGVTVNRCDCTAPVTKATTVTTTTKSTTVGITTKPITTTTKPTTLATAAKPTTVAATTKPTTLATAAKPAAAVGTTSKAKLVAATGPQQSYQADP